VHWPQRVSLHRATQTEEPSPEGLLHREALSVCHGLQSRRAEAGAEDGGPHSQSFPLFASPLHSAFLTFARLCLLFTEHSTKGGPESSEVMNR
jgi:hypothetical protein